MADEDRKPDEDEQAMKARLEALSAALDRRQQGRIDQADVEEANQRTGRAMSLGFRVLSEFVAGIIVGALIGWQLDAWFGTKPVLLIIMTMLGTAAGFWNVYRIAAAPTGTPGRGDDGSGR
jgi:ATP synthase protein I